MIDTVVRFVKCTPSPLGCPEMYKQISSVLFWAQGSLSAEELERQPLHDKDLGMFLYLVYLWDGRKR